MRPFGIDLQQPRGDGVIVSGGMREGAAAPATNAWQGESAGMPSSSLRIWSYCAGSDNDSDILKVLGGRANHCRAADIDMSRSIPRG